MLTRLWRATLDVIYPIRCVDCGANGYWLCQRCADSIHPLTAEHCPICWTPSTAGRTCTKCRAATPLDGLRVAASYAENPALAHAIHTLKYHYSTPLADTLGALLACKITRRQKYARTRLVTSVPLHADRERIRGFNQAALLAIAVARETDIPYVPLLIRTRATRQQAKLTRGERLKNVAHSFSIVPHVNIHEHTIILVDDVASTGATLAACADTLKKAGAAEVWGCVVARR